MSPANPEFGGRRPTPRRHTPVPVQMDTPQEEAPISQLADEMPRRDNRTRMVQMKEAAKTPLGSGVIGATISILVALSAFGLLPEKGEKSAALEQQVAVRAVEQRMVTVEAALQSSQKSHEDNLKHLSELIAAEMKGIRAEIANLQKDFDKLEDRLARTTR